MIKTPEVPCGWDCGFSGSVEQVAAHIKQEHHVRFSVGQIEMSLRTALARMAAPARKRRHA